MLFFETAVHGMLAGGFGPVSDELVKEFPSPDMTRVLVACTRRCGAVFAQSFVNVKSLSCTCLKSKEGWSEDGYIVETVLMRLGARKV